MENKKWNYLEELIEKKSELTTHNTESITLNFHILNFEFKLSDPKLKTKLSDHYKQILSPQVGTNKSPENTKVKNSKADNSNNILAKSTVIQWVDPKHLNIKNEFWELDPSPDCRQKKLDGLDLVIQRDFIAFYDHNDRTYYFTSFYTLDDGIYNFLRWMLPRYLIQTNKILLHSSCIVLNEKAYFCLGPSGAGKTTLSQLSSPNTVLDDDMNVVSINKPNVEAFAGAVGQRIEDPELFGKSYPVGGFFWLTQDDSCYVTNLRPAQKKMYLLRSVANLFWDSLTPRELEKVGELTNYLIENCEFKELHFNKSQEVWNHVFSEQQL